MDCTVFVRHYDAPPPDRKEALRYAGVKVPDEALSALLEDTRRELEPLLAYTVCFQELPLPENGAIPGFSDADSAHIRQIFPGCSGLVLFAATLGLGPDRLVTRYGHTSPARALLLQAWGAERIEALCDRFQADVAHQAALRGLYAGNRFSPGYGNLPLQLQRDIFRLLDCPRRMGLTLNESLLMSPTKSVTAFIGLRTCPGSPAAGHCASCGKTDCAYRREP